MKRFWRWLIGPAWVESECGKWRTSPDGRLQVWDTSGIDEFHGGYWRDTCCNHHCRQGRDCPLRR